MDVCLNMPSMKKPYVFAHNVRLVFINVPQLDIIGQKMNDIKLQYWDKVLVRMRLATKNMKYHTY